MSILDAIRELKRDNSNLQDLALLPQPLIMQMAQRGEIQKELVPLIISKKAEMIDAAARNQALARSGQTPPSVMEQKMMQIAQSENPAPEMMPQQMAQIPAPQLPEEVGIAQNPVAPMQMAGGGIIAFANTGLVDDEDEDDDTSYEDYLDEIERSKIESMIMNTYRDSDTGGAGIAYAEPSMPRSEKVGIGYIETAPKRVSEKTRETKDIKEDTRKSTTDADQSRKYNVGNLRPSGFSYPGQIGVSKGGFAMFDSSEAGINALYHDIGIKLNRGLDTPTKFISVYAPVEDKNDVKTYSSNVAKMLGIGPNDKIPNTPEARQLLANAIIRQEGAHKATAAFAGGGVIAFSNRGRVVDDFGNLIDEEKIKNKPLSKEAERFLKNKTARGDTTKAVAQPSTPKVRPSMIGSDANVYPGMSDLNYYNELNAALQKDPTYEPYKEEMDKLLKRTPNLLTATQPATNIIGPLANIKREDAEKTNTSYTPPVYLPGADNEDAAAGMGMRGLLAPKASVDSAAPPQTEAAMSAQDKLFAQMQDAFSKREARLAQARELDPYLALMSAGFGIAGGTSPYALTNIGQGGTQGVAQYAALQRGRAAEEAGLGSLQNKMLSTAMLGELRRDQMEQAKAGKEATLNQNLLLAKNKEIEKALADAGITTQMIGMLNTKRLLKTATPEELQKLKIFQDEYKNIENRVAQRYTSPGSNRGVIKLD